ILSIRMKIYPIPDPAKEMLGVALTPECVLEKGFMSLDQLFKANALSALSITLLNVVALIYLADACFICPTDLGLVKQIRYRPFMGLLSCGGILEPSRRLVQAVFLWKNAIKNQIHSRLFGKLVTE